MIWKALAKIAGKAIVKVKNVDPSDFVTQSTSNDVIDILKEFLW